MLGGCDLTGGGARARARGEWRDRPRSGIGRARRCGWRRLRDAPAAGADGSRWFFCCSHWQRRRGSRARSPTRQTVRHRPCSPPPLLPPLLCSQRVCLLFPWSASAAAAARSHALVNLGLRFACGWWVRWGACVHCVVAVLSAVVGKHCMAGGSEQSRAGDRIDSASSQVSTPVRGADGGSAERAAVPVALTFSPRLPRQAPACCHARRGRVGVAAKAAAGRSEGLSASASAGGFLRFGSRDSETVSVSATAKRSWCSDQSDLVVHAGGWL